MADKTSSLFDAEIQSILRTEKIARERQALEKADAMSKILDPNYNVGRMSVDTSQDQAYYDAAGHIDDLNTQGEGRLVTEHLQDMGAGLMGTLGAIGSTAILGGAALGDLRERVADGESDWGATASALKNMNQVGDYWQSLKSEKSKGFQRINQYRQDQALEQANAEAQARTGQDADLIDRLTTGFGTAVDSYLADPGQILTEGVAQLPYLLTGGVAKGITGGTKLANPLINQLTKKMSVESAEKLVQMGLVGGMQGTIEGADAASSTYARVMASTDTFGPGQEAEREAAALSAAAKAFGIAGATSAITGTLASKWELNPFSASGSGALGRTGDNLVKALQEGVQETIESGTSQFASNLTGNEVLKGKDLVGLDEGVGGAAGQGFVVGMGSTVITNPRSVVDAAVAVPLVLAGKGFGYMGSKARATEQREDMAVAVTTADEIVANITTPAMSAALNAGVQQPVLDATGNEQTVDTPAENVVLPPEIDTRNQVSLFATGMQYLDGKDMNSEDAVGAFHVLGSVLAAASNIRNLRDAAAVDAADQSLSPEARADATKKLDQLKLLMSDEKLDALVEAFPMEDIESELEDLRQNPESFGSAIAYIAARNPLKLTDKLIETGLESKSLPKAQRDSLLLAQELKEAEAELAVDTGPSSSEVSRSILQTGFPKAAGLKSVADMLRNVTSALAQDDQLSAQSYFNKMTEFSQYLTARSGRFEQALADMNASGEKGIDVPDTKTWVNNKLTDTPFRLVQGNEKSLGVRLAVKKDAETVAKMVEAMQKRTGLNVVVAAPKAKATTAPVTTPEGKPFVEVTTAPVEASKPAAEAVVKPEPTPKPEAAPVVEESNELTNLSDEAIGKAIEKLTQTIKRRRNNNTGNAVEQDILYNNLVREQARRIQGSLQKFKTNPVKTKPVDKPVVEPAKTEAVAVAAPVDMVIDEGTAAVAEATQEPVATEAVIEPSKNHFEGMQASYPVEDGATGTDRNDATNHLSQSFLPSDQPGLRSKGEALTNLDKLKEETKVEEGEDVVALTALFDKKEQIKNRLQQMININGVNRAKRLLGGEKLWAEAKRHYLYATQWSADTGMKYHDEIAEIMAWTGAQHMLDMLNPVSWSNDLLQQLQDTYGEGIREKMMDGWVPLKEQTEQLARKLQTNLELRGDKKVSVEYTEGTMLALAGRIMESMIRTLKYDGPIAHETITTLPITKTDKEGNETEVVPGIPVQWVKMIEKETVDGESSQEAHTLLFSAARILEKFLPERTSTSQAHIGEPPKGVNPFYRGSQQQIGKEQKEALKNRSNVAHKLSPLLLNMWRSIPSSNNNFWRMFGMDLSVADFSTNPRDLSISEIARKGAYRTTNSDLRTIHEHMVKVANYAKENNMDIKDVPSFFEYEQVTNGRAMTKGTSPQSSKWYREMFAIAQYELDPAKDNRGFLMAVAQGFGVKMDIQKIDESLAKLAVLLAKPEMKRALEAATRLGDKHDYSNNETLLEEDLAAIEALEMERSPHMMSALIHYAQYQKGKPFTSSLMYEIDGKTDGPINLMMLMGLTGSAADMEAMLGLGGLFFDIDGSPVAVQDMTELLKSWNGEKKDLYEIITGKATKLAPEFYDHILAAVVDNAKPQHKDSTEEQAGMLMKATLHLVKVAGLASGDAMNLVMEFERAFSKKSTQAAGYLQGGRSISGDLLNTIMETISKKMDADTLTEEDKTQLNIFFSHSLGSTRDEIYFNGNPKAYRDRNGEKFEFTGKPLTHRQWQTARATVNTFIGGALFSGLVETIGPQRNTMMEAVTAMQGRITYADHVLKTRYLAKQAELVKAGELHKGQALSKVDEQAIMKDVWAKLVPHPMLRNTAGLPVGSFGRTNGNPLAGSLEMPGTRRVENHYFEAGLGQEFRHNSGLTEAVFENPGVSFAALSIMAAGDGSMMTGLFNKMSENVLDMYDGLYMNPEIIDKMGKALNQEVKANWEHDFIGAILTSLEQTNNEGFQKWAAENKIPKTNTTYLEAAKEAETKLKAQRERQIITMREINAKPHWVSHMAYDSAAKFEGEPLNSTTLGTSVTDPLLDLAADDLGHVANGIRKMSAADVKSLLNEHTFENPILSGLWKVLAPLISDNLTLFMSADMQAMADFYQQSEGREMGSDVNGISIGDRVYVRTINAETLVHELLHAVTKNLTATFFSNPAALTPQQREAMGNLKALANEFMQIDTSELTLSQEAMVEHVQAIMRGYVAKGDLNSAMQEFLAYGLTNYNIQRTLGQTKSKLGAFFEDIFNAIKKLFGFPNGTQSDSMLAHLFSDFQDLVEGTANVVYPVSADTALESVNPTLARSFKDVISLLEGKSVTKSQAVGARADARTRIQEMYDSGLFPNMTPVQHAGAEYVQAIFSAGLDFKATESALLARVVDQVRDAGPKMWRTNADPQDQTDIDLAQARFEFFFEAGSTKNDVVADILSMSLLNPEFSAQMDKEILTRQDIDKTSFNNWLDSSAKWLYEKMDTGLQLKRDATLANAVEVAAIRLRNSMLASIKRQETKPGAYRKLTDKLNEGVQLIGEKAGKAADARLQLKSNKDWIGSGLMILAGTFNNNYADMLANMTLSMTNHMAGANPGREVIQEMIGTTSDNYKLIKLKGIAARMISAIRQTFREQVPTTVKSWFKDLTPEQDELLHTVIGKNAVYSLSQNMKDRMEELLTDPSGAKLDTETLLMSGGNRTKRLLMIKYAKLMGDRMANRGNAALYLNTRAVAGLALHRGGTDVLSVAEMAALENLSTLQAMSHMSPRQRRQVLEIYRENPEGFWKTTALVNSFFDYDNQRAGDPISTLNMQKGWIPVEADGRKKVKLFQKSEIKKAERMGWVQVGEFADDSNLVYMATTVGKTPTLSGGAIHAVDYHMNGIHYHSGMPTDPSIQTIITHPKAVSEIRNRILNGEVLPYTALYDAAGDVEGFQRLLDPAVVERHTKTVGRITDAAGIWLGRLHEESVAHGQNQAAADLLRKTWDEGKRDKREKEFINIRQPINPKDPNAQQDRILVNVWETLPYHTKIQMENAFDDGSKNPPIWIRRDQLNDAIGYHKATVGNFFTGDNRYEKSTNDNVAALSRQFLGKNAYKYLTNTEAGWQAIIATAKDTIIVKSLTVALNNLASNQTQLYMITGNPVWNLRVQAQKHRELVSYLGYQQRVARLTAEGLATNDPKAQKRIDSEQAFLKIEMRKLSIYSLIEAGEMPTIAEGLSETEEFSMVGDLTNWLETQTGKLPPVVGTVLNNLAISKETSIYKGLDRMIQYGDFVAKAAMYEWLTTQDKGAKKEAYQLMLNDTSKKLTMQEALHTIALMEVNDEFVNYARLPGRWRTYGEDMGLLWFYNYKLRIMKMAFRRIRKNPAAFLIASQVGGMIGIQTLMDTMPQNVSFSYSTGMDPLFSAHETLMWNQLF